MEKPYELKPSQKMLELAEKCSEAWKVDNKTNSWSNFDKFVESVIFECMGVIRKKYAAKFPALTIKRCNTKEFEGIKLQYGVNSKKTRAFYLPELKLIAVDLQASMKHDVLNFVTNIVLDYTEELLHSAFPSKRELEIKTMTHDSVEGYLGIEIPAEYKKMSLDMAGSPSYGKD